jgi:hypothetical protein
MKKPNTFYSLPSLTINVAIDFKQILSLKTLFYKLENMRFSNVP